MAEYLELFMTRWFWIIVGLLSLWALWSVWYLGIGISIIDLVEAVISSTMIAWFFTTIFYVLGKMFGGKK